MSGRRRQHASSEWEGGRARSQQRQARPCESGPPPPPPPNCNREAEALSARARVEQSSPSTGTHTRAMCSTEAQTCAPSPKEGLGFPALSSSLAGRALPKATRKASLATIQ